METFQISDIISNGDFSLQSRDTLSVLWAVTRACNFNCSYCTYSRDFKLADEIFSTKEDLLGAARKLLDLNRPGYQITLYGGEPTFHPNFLDLLTFLGESQAPISLRMFTNGSRSPSFFEQVFALSKGLPFGVIFSLHLERARFDNFKKVLEIAVNAGTSAGVSLMIEPKWRDESKRYAEELLALCHKAPFFMNIVIPYAPGGIMGEECTAEDHAWIKQVREEFARIAIPAHLKSPFFTRIQSNITLNRDGGSVSLPPEDSLQLLSKPETASYRNFYCCGGTNVWFLAPDGTVSGGVCESARHLFNIFRDPMPEIVSKMAVVRCTAPACNSIENIPLPKFRNSEDAEACIADFKERAMAYYLMKPVRPESATVHSELHHPEADEAALNGSLGLLPDDPTALKLIADNKRDNGHYQEAGIVYGKLINHHPDQLEILLSLAKCFDKLGDQEGAQAALEHVLALDPGNAIARENLMTMQATGAQQQSLISTFQISDIISSGDFALQSRDTLSVLWALTRACNFNCSYCTYSRDFKLADETFSTKEEILGAARKLLDLNRPGYQITLYGGEPTFHPNFLDLLTFLGDSQAPISLRMFTNGSRSPGFFEQVFALRKGLPFGVIFSLHLERARLDNFKKVLEIAVNSGTSAGVSLMFDPKWREESKRYTEELLALCRKAPFFMNIVIPYTPDGIKGKECTAEDHVWIKQVREEFARISTPAHLKSPFFTRVQSNITLNRDGRSVSLAPEDSLQLRSKAENPSYRNFYCCGGTNVWFLAPNGAVSGGVCESAPALFNIFRDPMPEIVSKMAAVRCTAPACNCLENIPLPKFRDSEDAESCIADFKERAMAYYLMKPGRHESATVHSDLHHPQAAEAAQNHAPGLRPNDPTALKLLADSKRDNGRYQEAGIIYGKLINQHPDQLEILLSLAKCFDKLGDREGAQAALEQVLAIDPNNETAHDNLGVIGTKAGASSPAPILLGTDTGSKLSSSSLRLDFGCGEVGPRLGYVGVDTVAQEKSFGTLDRTNGSANEPPFAPHATAKSPIHFSESPHPRRDVAYYQRLHEQEPSYQTNNWLLDEIHQIASFRANTVLELACGNGRFLECAAPLFERVMGCDWAVSPRIEGVIATHSNVKFFQVDLYQHLPPCRAELVVSADFLEHMDPHSLLGVLQRIDSLADMAFHKIACYDDMHSHLSVLPPAEWLALFRSVNPAYRLERVELRKGDPARQLAVFSKGHPDAALIQRGDSQACGERTSQC